MMNWGQIINALQEGARSVTGLANGMRVAQNVRVPRVAASSYGPRPPTGMIPPPAAPSGAPGAINGRHATMPSNETLGFDPNGPGAFGAVIRHPLDALRARSLSKEAEEKTQALYPGDAGQFANDEADAFPHAYWNYRMAQTIGSQEAQQFGNAYEIYRPNPAGERMMDLYNNQVGRQLSGLDAGGKDPAAVIQDAIKNGRLRVSPF